MRTALWGYGIYGKRIYTLMKKYSPQTEITGIYDMAHAGEKADGLTIADPEQITRDFADGLFENVMVCVNLEQTCIEILTKLKDSHIPVYTPCSDADFVPAEEIAGVSEKESGQPGYRMYAFRNLRGMTTAPSSAVMYLFDASGHHLKEQWDAYSVKEVWTHIYDLPVNTHSIQPETVFMSGSYCILAKLWAFNYSHFSFESMDCIQLMEEAGFTGRYVVPERSYIRELLQIYGIPDERILTLGDFTPGVCYEFEEVHYPKLMQNDRHYSAPVLKRMAERIQKKLTLNHDKYPRYLYVKRVGIRKLLNGEEIAERYGFDVMIPEEHSLLEQMNYYYNADIVFSPHGANNATTLYMRPEAAMVETFGRNWVKYSYLYVLHEKGTYYLPVVEGPIMPEFIKSSNDRGADYTIDETNLQAALDIAFRLTGNTQKK
ncbi:MAG: glycosyltransferase family 61 protein [Solobacterium sp.]|nr:glycosyltransferase family 61 protein [Solobacterium sp.]